MSKNQKLELTWYGKDEELNIEPRILLENKELSNTAQDENTENMLIHGDNLLTLKSLEQNYSGRIKCIYIDPPYNINAAGVPYNDNIEHSLYLTLMRERLRILRNLLKKDGLIYISINYEEMFHLKLLCDEIFGKNNFVNIICIKTATTGSFRAINECPVNICEYILVYARNKIFSKQNPVYVEASYSEDYDSYIENFDKPIEQWCMKKIDDKIYEIFNCANVNEFKQKFGDAWKTIRHIEKEKFARSHADSVCSLNTLQKPSLSVQMVIEKSKENKGKFYYVKRENKDPIVVYNGRTLAFYKKKLRKINGKLVPTEIITNIWTDISYLSLGVEGNITFVNSKKPEKLLERILLLSTQPGDFVLDSFLGSGTTCAVAHKMGRKWIGVEMGDHAYTHCKVRLDKVISGEDLGGITKAVNWQGGGGYKFYELAPTLIKEDSFGQAVINPEYNAEMLAAAVAKYEGYFYAPDGQLFWKQSNNRGKSYLYVTTNHVTIDIINAIKADMQDDEFVLIVCKSYDQSCVGNKNISIKKMPQSLLENCEFGKDDYSLNIVCPPEYKETDDNE